MTRQAMAFHWQGTKHAAPCPQPVHVLVLHPGEFRIGVPDLQQLVHGRLADVQGAAAPPRLLPFPHAVGIDLRAPLPGPSAPSPCRRLSPIGGLKRVVCWGEFKHLLDGQIACPERLRPEHRLGCVIEVYEALRPLDWSDLARLLQRQRPSRLERLTPELAERLSLTRALPQPRQRADTDSRSGTQLLPADRFVELRVVEDPTTQSGPAGPEALARTKASVPSRWIRPWEFRLSRQEAAYDMRADRIWWRRVMRALGHAVALLANRAALHKWRMLLAGKPLDEQLWGVRPPRVALTDSRIRSRIAQALGTAGYNATAMLPEWEIFWRRKGV